jgi:hypothetical protein
MPPKLAALLRRSMNLTPEELAAVIQDSEQLEALPAVVSDAS